MTKTARPRKKLPEASIVATDKYFEKMSSLLTQEDIIAMLKKRVAHKFGELHMSSEDWKFIP